jgi:hypothetical protein
MAHNLMTISWQVSAYAGRFGKPGDRSLFSTGTLESV